MQSRCDFFTFLLSLVLLFARSDLCPPQDLQELFWVSLQPLFFHQYLLIYLFPFYCPIVYCCLVLVFSFKCTHMKFSFQKTFACFYNFFICHSTLILHPVFFSGTSGRYKFDHVLLQRQLARLVQLFYSLKYFVIILFTFSVSNLTFFRSWFLRDCNVIFFSVVIFYWFTIFLSYCVIVDVVVLSSVMFWLSVRVGGSSSEYSSWLISSIWRSENQQCFLIILAQSASLWHVVLNLEDSSHISIIFFLYPLWVWLLLK